MLYKLGVTGSAYSPQGGLRISANDLARVGQMFLRGGEDFLKPETLAVMTAPAWRFDGQNGDSEDGYFCGYGLGIHILGLSGRPASCKDEPFADGKTRYGHSGEAYSLRSGLWWEPLSKSGTAFFRTEVPDETSADHCIYFCR
ncbi:MAG: hypothetical protein U5J78_07405 [Parasphingorhabdus sp.]|nr:hypothetical protein [Parasphingorhabdus sp.]